MWCGSSGCGVVIVGVLVRSGRGVVVVGVVVVGVVW